jgi:Ca2+-binding RTX toxin-like protein
MPYRVPLYKLLALSSGKSVAVGYYDYGDGNTDFYLTRFGADTQVDYSFGSNGLIVTDYSGTIDTLDTAIPSTSNTFIAGGTSSVHSSFRKYDLNGNVIDSFGTNGTLLVRVGFYSSVTDIVKVANGFIAVCRATHINGRYDYSQNLVGLIKFSNDGVLDSFFGQHAAKLTIAGELDYSSQDNGKLIAPGIGYPFSSDMVLGDFDLFIEKISDQHFFVIGTIWEDPAWWGGGPHKIFLKKFKISDGTETDTFSAFENNLRTLDSSLSSDIATTLVDTRGKLLIVGTIIDDGGCFGIEAFDDMGNIDPTFGINGVAKVNFAAGGTEVGAYAHTATIDNKSGAIYVAGHNGLNGDHNLAVTKLTHEGIVDQSFGIDGKVTVSPFQEYTEFHVTDIQLVKNGDVLILFTSIDTSTLIRLDKHGNLLSGFVKGNNGSNEYFAPSSNDILYGMEGDDVIHGNLGNDHLDGGEGDDELVAGDGDDTVQAGLGDDLIIGGDGKGNDKYYGGEGTDKIKYLSATWGITVNLGTGKAASLSDPSDRKNKDASGTGKDSLSSIENLIAGNHDDILVGSKAANQIEGMDGNDKIDGKEGNDTLLGGADNDALIGGVGNDSLTGGAGDDRFVFDVKLNANVSNLDAITDFGDGADKIVLSKSAFKFAKGVVNKNGTLNSTATLSDYLVITGSGSNWSVAYDADGTGTKSQPITFVDVTLTGLSNALTSNDFLVL